MRFARHRATPFQPQGAVAPTHRREQRGAAVIPIVGAVAVLAMLFLGYQWYKSKDVLLSAKPEHKATAQVLDPQESAVVASIFVSHVTLHKVLNQIAQGLAGSMKNREEVKCISSDFPRFKGCVHADWEVAYKPGAIGVARANDLLKVTVPVSFNGVAGLNGDLARWLSLDRKNIDGEAAVSASLSLALDERFCPVLTVQDTEFGWVREAKVEVIGRTKILGVINIGPEYLNVGRHFNGPIRDKLAELARGAARAIPCDPVRAEIAKAWKKYSLLLTSEGQPPLYLNGWPEKLGSTGLQSEDTGIRLGLMLSGKAAVETKAGETGSLGELPAHVTLPAQPGVINLAVPVRVEYDKLKEAVKAAVASKQPFEQETPAGKVSVVLEDFEFYPSDERLAIGVTFKADAPSSIFDTTGTVWLSVKPEVGADRKSIRLTDASIYRKVDNQAVSLLTAVFEQMINQVIVDAAQYDLRNDEKKLVDTLQQAIADPAKTGGVRLTVTAPSVAFGRIAMEEKALAIEGLFKAGWGAEVQELKF